MPNTGLHPRPAEAALQRAFFPRVDAAGWSPLLYPPRAGEDVDGIHARSALAITALQHEIERRWPGKPQRVLLVTHAATAIALARALVGKRGLTLRIGCCTVSEFVPREGKMGGTKLGEWEAVRLGDGSFLKEGALRDWGFEDIELEGGEVCTLARRASFSADDLVGDQACGYGRIRERRRRAHWPTDLA